MSKTGNFEDDVRAGYYSEHPDEFGDDHRAWLVSQGVPDQYAGKVAWYAWQHGHSSGHTEILNVSYDLVEIFEVKK